MLRGKSGHGAFNILDPHSRPGPAEEPSPIVSATAAGLDLACSSQVDQNNAKTFRQQRLSSARCGIGAPEYEDIALQLAARAAGPA